jgi:hypothetical protein
MSNKSVDVYAKAMKRQNEEKEPKETHRRSGDPGIRRAGSPAVQKHGVKASRMGRDAEERESVVSAVSLYGEIEAVRVAVRSGGKERTDIGFSREEKELLRSVAYTRTQRGQRTAISEVVRVAVIWFLQDYATRKTKSILSKTLDIVQG